MKNIFIGLSSHGSYTTDEEISILLEIINRTLLPVHILSWSLPDKELTEDCFTIYKLRKRLPYDGKLVKRRSPQPEDFIQLAPGASIIRKIVLSKAYPVAQKGKFTVSFKSEKLVWPTGKPPKGTKILQKEAAFTVAAGKKQQLTLGQQFRTLEKRQASSRISRPSSKARFALTDNLQGARPPIIVGSAVGIPTAVVQQAHQQAYLNTLKALQDLTNGVSSAFTTWFGDPAQLNSIKGNFGKIIKDFRGLTFTYDLSGADCSPTALAHTFPGTTTIFLCPAFAGLPAGGLESKAGCVLHEHSHASADTLDFKNGPDDCRRLAIANPGQAADNADNYEFFSNSL